MALDGETGTFTNPALGRGADPFIHVEGGRYHLVQSGGVGVQIRSADSLLDLQTAPPTVIWEGGRDGSPCCEWWAPELHRLDGRWYVYVAADDGDNVNHRTYVLEADELLGPYRFLGELELPDGKWAIDCTVFDAAGTRYVSWSGWEGDVNGRQDIYLAKLASPTRAEGPRVVISTPELDWERSVADNPVYVNEGPAVLVRDGRVLLTYSASGCWTPDYALGLLTADEHADLLDPASWTKHQEPLLRRDDDAGIYGTGHNAFFTSPDGSETWNAFHAVRTPDGSCGPDREIHLQPVHWDAEGLPVLGPPISRGVPIPLPAGDPRG